MITKFVKKMPLKHSYPVCFYRYGDYCEYISSYVGRICCVDPIFCKFSCCNNGGACNEEKVDTLSCDFLKKSLSRSLPFVGPRFGMRVLRKYFSSFSIECPAEWKKIKEIFIPIINKYECLEGIYLTGSLIIPHVEKKDYDIVILINNFRQYIDNKDEIERLFPESINEKKTDIFIATNLRNSFFLIFDPDKNTIITSRHFVPNIKNANDFNIVQEDFEYSKSNLISLVSLMYDRKTDIIEREFLISSIKYIYDIYGEDLIYEILGGEKKSGQRDEYFFEYIADKFDIDIKKIDNFDVKDKICKKCNRKN